MKTRLLEILFWILILAFLLGMFGIAELLINVINMKTIMTAVYITLGYSFIYILKN